MGRQDFRGVDLFGCPLPVVRERAGRPEHEWTIENSHKINLLFAMGYHPKDAAAALGITMPTLRKHYFSEMAQWRIAALQLKAKLLAGLVGEHDKGNVSASKELMREIERGTVRAAQARVEQRAAPQPRAAKLGKKAQAREDAGAIGGKFAPLPGPMLIQ